MSDPNYGGNFCDPEGGLYIPRNELRRELRVRPHADGQDEAKSSPAGSNKPLDQESFLPEEEKPLKGGAGPGPRSPDDPANDA